MNTIDRSIIDRLSNHPRMTNVAFMTYLSAVLMCSTSDLEPCIKDFKVFRLYRFMDERMDCINKSSIYDAFGLLVELDFFKNENNTLYLPGLGDHHIKGVGYKSLGYIYLHKYLFTSEFYNSPLRDKKMLIVLLSKLNNEKKRDPIKLTMNDPDIMAMCKVNRPAHVKKILERLSKVLKIWNLKGKVYACLLAEKTHEVFKGESTTIYTPEEIKRIRAILKSRSIDLNERTIELIAHALHRKKARHVVSVMTKFIDTYKSGRRIRRPAAYIRAISTRILSEV